MTLSLVQNREVTSYEKRNGFPMQPIRCHHLKAAGRSPAHAKLVLSGEEEDEPSESMRLGSLVHMLIEGRKDILVYRGASRRGKEWEVFKAAHANDVIVLDKEMKTAEHMAKALLAKPEARDLLKARAVHREETLYFDYLGRACRSTPDLRGGKAAKSWVADLKTTRCADPERFKWDVLKFGYHVQLAMQSEAIRVITGKAPVDHYIIAVESAAPWPVTVMHLDEKDLDLGHRQLRLWMERLLSCEASGAWPEYASAVVPLKLTEGRLDLDYGDGDGEAA